MLFFRCTRSTWREDLCLEDHNIEVAEYDMATGFKNSIEKWEPSGKIGTPLETRKRYFSIVHAYLRRQLTYESDILDAIAGIHNHLGEQADLKIHFGIPLDTFGCDVFWVSDGRLQRRLRYPSWSWVGWKGGEIKFPANESFIHQDKIQLKMSGWIRWYKWIPESDGFEDMTASQHNDNSKKSTLQLINQLIQTQVSESSNTQSYIASQPALPKRDLAVVGLAYRSQALKAPEAVLFRTLTASVVLSSTHKESNALKLTESAEQLPPIPWLKSITRSKTEYSSKPLGSAKLNNDDTLLTIWRTSDLPESKFDSISGKRLRIALISGPLRPCLGSVNHTVNILRMIVLYELPVEQKEYILAERIGVGEVPVDCFDHLEWEERNIILH
jgi:hypothetical protein